MIRFWIIAFVLALSALQPSSSGEAGLFQADLISRQESCGIGLARSGTACIEALRLGGGHRSCLGRFSRSGDEGRGGGPAGFRSAQSRFRWLRGACPEPRRAAHSS